MLTPNGEFLPISVYYYIIAIIMTPLIINSVLVIQKQKTLAIYYTLPDIFYLVLVCLASFYTPNMIKFLGNRMSCEEVDY